MGPKRRVTTSSPKQLYTTPLNSKGLAEYITINDICYRILCLPGCKKLINTGIQTKCDKIPFRQCGLFKRSHHKTYRSTSELPLVSRLIDQFRIYSHNKLQQLSLRDLPIDLRFTLLI